MGLMTKDNGGSGNFEPLPMGTHIARCASVVDLGVQDTAWGGKEKVYLGFEVPAVRVQWKDKEGVEHEGPAFIGSTYTNSINEKAILGQHLTSWRGVAFTDQERQGFDLFTVLGAPCMISVVHNEKNGNVYANIQSIMRLPQGMTCPPAESEAIAYTPMDPNIAPAINKLPDWLQKKVRAGYKIAEGSHIIGSAVGHQTGPAPGQPAPQVPQTPPASMHPPQTADQAMAAATAAQQNEAGGDYFDDDIPF